MQITILKISVLGPPASGKGTQADYLAEELKVPHIATGNILRAEIAGGTEIGSKVKEIMDRGDIPSDGIVNEIFKKEMTKLENKDGFVLDGFPRRVSQAEFFDTFDNLTHVIYLDTPDKDVISRLSGRRTCEKCAEVYHLVYNPPKDGSLCDKCGGNLIQRADDKPGVIKNRLEAFRKETLPVIEYYKKQGILVTVDGSPSIEEVKKDIFSELGI